MIVVALSIWLNAPVPNDILDSMRHTLVSVESLDYRFTTSLYPDRKIRFRSHLTSTRMDGVFPYGKSSGVSPSNHAPSDKMTELNFAFNGAWFQERSAFDQRLAVSRSRIGGSRSNTSGPCWSPLEECYRFLAITDYFGFNWQSARDPATWQKLEVSPDMEEITFDAYRVYVLRLTTHVGWYQKLYVAPDLGFFPLRYVMHTEKGQEVEEMVASGFIERQSDQRSFWFPTSVVHRLYEVGEQKARTVEYAIDSTTLVINERIDPAIFDLERSEAVSLKYDLDKKELFRIGDEKPVWTHQHAQKLQPVIPDEHTPVNAQQGNAKAKKLLLLVNAVVVVMLCLFFAYRYWRSRVT